MQKFIYILALILVGPGILAQNGWMRKKGQTWSQLSYQQWQSSTFYNGSGDVTETANSFHSSEWTLYSELGVSERFNLIVNAPLLKTARFSSTESASGRGDLKLEAKLKPFKGATPFAVQVGLEVPTGKSQNIAYNLDRNLGFVNLPTGDGEWNFWLSSVYSRGITQWMYATIHSAFNLRTSYLGTSYANQLRSGIEVGFSPLKETWCIFKFNSLVELTTNSENSDFLRQSGTNFNQYGIMVLSEIYKGFGASVQLNGFTEYPAKLTNLYTANYLSFGIFYHVRKVKSQS